jgi:hypothetical protein
MMAAWRPRSRNRPRSPCSSGCSPRARERWPALAEVKVRFRGRFAYIDGQLDSGEVLPLCRLRYASSATVWGFAVWLASKDGYQDSFLNRPGFGRDSGGWFQAAVSASS